MSSKAREALKKLVEVIDECASSSPLWWHSGAKGVTPLKNAKAVLDETVRNFEVGTPDEQRLRHYKWCRKHGLDGDGKANCLGRDMSCSRCVLLWSHMPYNTEG